MWENRNPDTKSSWCGGHNRVDDMPQRGTFCIHNGGGFVDDYIFANIT